MKADIVLTGPTRYGVSMWELQAHIQVADKSVGTLNRTVKWSTHNHKKDAEEYRDRFNSFKGE